MLPGPDFLDRTFVTTDRSPAVLRGLGELYRHGRLGGTGYLSIFPVDQGIEHSGAASFAPNPIYFDPANILKLAVEKGAEVSEGDLVCVIEAMKMENEITAHRDGKVTELAISEGASVSSGDLLARIE